MLCTWEYPHHTSFVVIYRCSNLKKKGVMLVCGPWLTYRHRGRARVSDRVSQLYTCREHQPVLERRCICVLAFWLALLVCFGAAFDLGGCATAMLTGAALIRSPWVLGGRVDICILCSRYLRRDGGGGGGCKFASRAKAGGDQGYRGPQF